MCLYIISAVLPPGTWLVDPARSRVGFSVRHMMVSTVQGQFRDFTGAVEVGQSGQISASGSVVSASVDTDDADRDTHLQGDEFFAAGNFPEITFTSTSTESQTPSGLLIVGDLTMRGITKSVQLEGDLEPPENGQSDCALTIRAELSRKQFGLSWNQVIETGGVAVSDKVKLALDLVLCAQ